MHSAWTLSLFVGLGGFAGSVARYGLGGLAQRFTEAWPLGTFAANVIGCLLIGVIAGLSGRGESISPAVRLALATGFCGGFTTMSSFIYELGQFVQGREYFFASTYFVVTLAGAGLAFMLGLLISSLVMR